MSWFQLKKSPPDPRTLSSIEYNGSNATRNNESNNMRNYNMNDNDNYIDRALQQRIETHLLPSYIPQQQQFHVSSPDRQQNRSLNMYSDNYHHPSYRNYDVTYKDSNSDSFFDYNIAGRKKKMPILSPIVTSKMNSLRVNENIQQQNKQQHTLLSHRSQSVENDIRHSIENQCDAMSGVERSNCNSNDRNHADLFNSQQEQRNKKKKYSRLEVMQTLSSKENHNRMDDDGQLAANKMTYNTIMEDNTNQNNVVLNKDLDTNKAKRSNANSLVDTDDRQEKKKRRSKKQKSKDSSKENSKRTKTKKKTSNADKSQSTLPLNQYQQQQPRIRSKKYMLMTEDMFEKIDQCGIFNAGSTNEALDAFFNNIQNATEDYIAWTIVFYDQDLTSTSFEPICKKYCTPKRKCMNWNCTCDGQIRSVQVGKPLFGAMFNVGCPNDDGIEKMCFILPLGPTSNSTTYEVEGFERMSIWPKFPFYCSTSIRDRWDVLKKVILQKNKKLITYNAVMSLMVLHYHKMYDIGSEMDLMITSTWDLRLASWILKPHAKEEELEFDHLLENEYPQIRQKVLNEVLAPNDAPPQLKSLMKVRQNLECIYELYPIIDKVLSEKNLHESFHEIESPLQGILAAMECHGVGFLPGRLKKRQEKLQKRIDELNTNARNIARDPNFLLSSPQQVSNLIYNVLKIPFPAGINDDKNSSSSQQLSTNTSVLEAILSTGTESNPTHEIINIILEFRNLNKLLTSFILPLPTLAIAPKSNSITSSSSQSIHRIHPMWNQTAVRTGRLSCRKPNMQQIPTSITLGISPRDSFCASTKEMCLFACDYCQNEIRILAHMSNDPQLIKLFQDPSATDIYKQMSSSVTGKQLEEITDKERGVAKQVTLAIIYGMGIQQVSKKLKISTNEAKTLFNKFFSRFVGIKRWMNNTKEFARKNKYVLTIAGRRRYLDDIHSTDSSKRAQAERQAVNTIIQGSAADLMKLAMLKMSCRILDWKKEICSYEHGSSVTGRPPKLVLQIHDELLFEVAANQTDVNLLKDIVVRCCAEECERDLKLKVPLKLKFNVGISWGENMKEL